MFSRKDVLREGRVTLRIERLSRYQDLVRRSADVITLLDETGVIEIKRESVGWVLGYGPAGLVGESLFEYVHPDDRAQVLAIVVAAIAPSRYEIGVRTATEDRLVGEVNASRFRNVGAPAVLVAIRDATERTGYQDELEAATDELEGSIGSCDTTPGTTWR